MRHSRRVVNRLVTSVWGVAMLAGATVCQAAIIEYTIAPPTSGSISYAGGGGAMIGSNISVDSVLGFNGTPLNGNTALNCVGCALNFTTGSFLSSQSTQTNITAWLFGGGGNISLTGNIMDTSNSAVLASGTLFSGSFTGSATLQLSTNAFVFSVATGALTGQNNSTLLGFFGLPANGATENGRMAIVFQPVGNPTVATPFSSRFISSGSILTDVVPLPAAGWLFISGIAGLGWLRRRRGRALTLPVLAAG
ncbi:MAG: VPLPA-CTERM sorting domain-containing protein [Gammaproteobacteria bacterium]|nr:VPLPA-CTERM sorting domain-containing protein [Gammaproteobacteria bacterium]